MNATGPSFVALLLIFFVSLELAAGQLAQVLLPARTWGRRLDRAGVVFGFLLACLLSLEVVRQSEVWLPHSWQIPVALLVFSLATIVPYVHWRVAQSSERSGRVARFGLRSTLAVLCALTAAWSGDRFYAMNSAFHDAGLLFDVPGSMAEARRFVALTDKGKPLALYRWRVAEEEFLKYSQRSATRLSGITESAIPRSRADRHANCHGWVFAEGRFLVYGREVEQILRDNGYYVVTEPRADDVVVYRDGRGEIAHTGLVCGVLHDGTVIVESKFGIDGRYLHQPQDQPFSQTWDFYRSDRAGHAVTIKRVERENPTG